MDSQITLVDSDPDSELAPPDLAFGATTILDFDSNARRLTNATVRGESHTRYSVRTIRTGLAGMNRKTIFSQGERILATVQRRNIIPDVLTLGGETMRLGGWLKTPIFSSFPASFREGRETYRWKKGRDGRIDLYKGSGADTSTIARFYPSDFAVTRDRRRITYRAHLDLRAEADLIREKVFISCVLIVQKRKKVKVKEQDLVSVNSNELDLIFFYAIAPVLGF